MFRPGAAPRTAVLAVLVEGADAAISWQNAASASVAGVSAMAKSQRLPHPGKLPQRCNR
jgi:hypothetical protein